MADLPKKIPNIIVRDIPAEIKKILTKEQAKEKDKRGTSQYSLSSTIIKIIREWSDKCRQD